MFHSILVPLDGTKFAEAALPIAELIAQRAGASLEIVRSHEPFISQVAANGWAPPYDREGDAAYQAQEQAYLDATADTLQQECSINVQSALVNGAVVSGVLKRARAIQADLIVMATHGHGPVGRFLLGSVADELLRLADLPILLVRSGNHSQEWAVHDLGHILVPLDGSKLAEQALPPATRIGRLVDAQYTLVRAVEPHLLPSGRSDTNDRGHFLDGSDQRTLEAARYLEKVAGRLRLESRRVEKEVLAGEAAGAILHVASSRNVDLIAIATHGRSGLKRLFLGSVADRVIRHSPVPVLAYRPMNL